jgi:sn-glycerol 3-phosphate transport system substrate-binding protein
MTILEGEGCSMQFCPPELFWWSFHSWQLSIGLWINNNRDNSYPKGLYSHVFVVEFSILSIFEENNMFSNKRRLLVAICLMAMLIVPMATSMAQDATEIRVWVAFSGYRLDWAVERAEEFNTLYPEYNVMVEGYASYNDAFTATVLAVEQGTPPAITHFFEAATQEARDAVSPDGEPLFKSVEAAIAGRTEINGVPVVLDDVVSAAADYYALDGEFGSMPWNTSSTVMFSNMSILEAAGIMEIPETWAEINAACEVIMALDDGPDNCITWPNHSWFFEQSVAQQGADLANNGNGRDGRADEVLLNSDAALAYAGWWKDLNDMGYYIYTGVLRDWTGTQNAFEAEQVAFLVFSSSDATLIPANTAENFETVVSRMPYNDEVEYAGNIIGGATLWLNNGLDEATETGALMFLNWFSKPENTAEWHQLTGYIPITNAGVELLEAEGWFEENPNAAVASWQLDLVPNTGALIGNFVAIRDVITAGMEEILLNGADVAETMDEVNEEANQLLEEYNFLYADE